MQEKGTISVNTENIFPIIKKFLYSDNEIFLRELVSNGIDASQKIKSLASVGEYKEELGELKVKVTLDKEAKTITISDNGIGMTAEEIKKYINQLAFSGATEFVEKYKDVDAKQMIGNFGLGFYSAFMVAHKVRIVTKSYKEGSEAAQWIGEGSTSFQIEPAVKKERGTDIILHIAEDSEEFLDDYRLRTILNKYAKFLPVTVMYGEEVINDTEPLWTKNPSELKDEDYINFYKVLYPNAQDPLFWIHLNVDYPFNLTGILYFPQISNSFDLHREKIQLYSRQVFITDEVKDIVPEFLMLLHGVIDSPDIPLNVSRSFLQADSNVKKINGYITKKVADKLNDLYKSDRAEFEKKWESIGLFIKYGLISDEKFYERAEKICMVKNTEDKLFTFDEYREHIQAAQTDKNENLVWIYTNDKDKQHTYINSATKKGFDVLVFDNPVIDQHFISSIERKLENTTIKRVDSEIADKIVDTGITQESVLSEDESKTLKELFEKILNNKNLTVEVSSLSPDEMPVILTQSEMTRRMQEMAQAQGYSSYLNPELNMQFNVAVNANHEIIQKIIKAEEAEQTRLILQTYDLALLSKGMLGGANLGKFITRSIDML